MNVDTERKISSSVMVSFPVICGDLDEDCAYVTDKQFCWDHDREKGRCPFVDYRHMQERPK